MGYLSYKATTTINYFTRIFLQPALGFNTCYYVHPFNNISALIDDQLLLSKLPKRRGYFVIYTSFEVLLLHLSLKEEWNEFFMGSAFGLLDNEGTRSQENWGIYWHYVKRFFERQGLRLLPILSSDLPFNALLSVVKGNMKLSGFNLTDEQVDLISLAANEILSDQGVLQRLRYESSSSNF